MLDILQRKPKDLILSSHFSSNFFDWQWSLSNKRLCLANGCTRLFPKPENQKVMTVNEIARMEPENLHSDEKGKSGIYFSNA